MEKFHSTVSRREFMKGLGVAGAGLGVASLNVPAFADIDELTSSAPSSMHRWWVKERDFEDITSPVDWNVWQAYDPSLRPMPSFFDGPLSPEKREARAERHKQGIVNNWPGTTLRDLALDGATGGNAPSIPWDSNNVDTPAQRGAPGPWQGTAEENLQTCRAAAHFYGAPKVGAIEINDHMKRLFNVNVVWENIDEPSYDGNIYHIPNKCRYILVWIVKQNYYMSQLALRNDPDDPWYNTVFRQGKAGENQAYSHGPQVRNQITKFIKGLGYHALKPQASQNVGFGVFAGLIEQGRASMGCSPDYGNLIRYVDFAVTDMPLAPTKPIESGLVKFCETCKRCAENCPSKSLSLETEQTWDTAHPGNNPGIKHWPMDWGSCGEYGGPFDCVNCHSICPMNHPEDAVVHPFVRATAGTTTLFNGFFAAMDETMGYGKQRTDEEHLAWWNRDLSNWKEDSLLGFGTKGW
ncbi:reductive dehalogenase [Dehalogenimonas lykanthroporepellens BL-DC-9]|nr:reductive dehalogenase [Dehalogenimonas lykanthroporepellens BL-DC-9]